MIIDKYINIISNSSENTIIKVKDIITSEEYKLLISGILSGEIKIKSCSISENDSILNILGYWDDFENPYIIGDNILDIVDDMFFSLFRYW